MRSFFFKSLMITALLAVSSSVTLSQFAWTKYPSNPLSIHGTSGSWDRSVVTPFVLFNSDLNRYEMWYTSYTGSLPNNGIGFAWSTDGIIWTKHPTSVLTPTTTSWDYPFVGAACVLKEGGTYKMWYTGGQSGNLSSSHIGYATSPDGVTWTKYSANPVLSPGTGWESGAVGYPSVIKISNTYYLFYTGAVSVGIGRTGRAISTDGIIWQKDIANNPVLPAGGAGLWDQNNYLANVLEFNNTLYLFYTAENNPGVSGTAIGVATSVDTGRTWVKYLGNPIISRGSAGAWDNGWIETGCILFKDNIFKIWYDGGGSATSFLGRIGYATSENVIPVELTSFTALALGNEVTLKWSTATELNNKGFEIQRKFGSSEFATIGSVKGHGTTTSPNQYSYVDNLIDGGKYYYRLKQIDFNGTFEYSNEIEIEVRVLDKFTLEQNYSNPFNPTTTIGYVLHEKSNTKLTILNSIGEEIAVLVNEEQDKGYHKVDFNAANLSSGVYFYQLRAGNFLETKKMVLLK